LLQMLVPQMATSLLSLVTSRHQAKDLLVKALPILEVLPPLKRKDPHQMLDQVGCIRTE
jgi:hypothetical protein